MRLRAVGYCDECDERRPLRRVRFRWQIHARGVCAACVQQLEHEVCALLGAWLGAQRAAINSAAKTRVSRAAACRRLA